MNPFQAGGTSETHPTEEDAFRYELILGIAQNIKNLAQQTISRTF